MCLGTRLTLFLHLALSLLVSNFTVLGPISSLCGPGTHSNRLSWEPGRNAQLRAHFRLTESASDVNKNPQGGSHTHSNTESAGLDTVFLSQPTSAPEDKQSLSSKSSHFWFEPRNRLDKSAEGNVWGWADQFMEKWVKRKTQRERFRTRICK